MIFVQVDTLFQELGTRLCYERAEDPNAFLIKVSVVRLIKRDTA
jgi:hypothetical protein